jgi:cyclophilin family peptidyl-prolyl cis-trans isomerase
MKKLLFIACATGIALSAVHADDVALLTFQVGADKLHQKQVAIEFYEADAPQTVANFKKLARKHFYDGLAFHRIFPHILVQTGDPYSRYHDRSKVGTGGPGYTVPAEIHRKHTKGAIAAARLNDKINPLRLSNGSQFLVCLTPMPAYDGKYTVFGNVLWGLDALDEVSQLPVDTNDNPVQRVEIKSVKIIPREQLSSGPSVPPPPAPKGRKPWWKVWQRS